MAERRYGPEDVKSARFKVAVRLLQVLADHLPTIALFLLSIVLHQLLPYLRTENALFNQVAEYSVYVIFGLGMLRIIKWALIEFLSRE